ncbi:MULTISPECIES: hypothetical protein [Streptomyces]|uniref:J domain-containing protein n=1 Tax=Streptomyces dengpaensis TaxID=2049881 RepID=A0ABM6SUK8_9ACTN|nr:MULTISPECIES: hypothetical protein [Streptomyces]AVH58408.1 hypothetical protein C4B68_24510 [Streptomyces dengpaensis]PIB06082.1 hypothetical protein B1C81_26230 [Streptomyces sp. HG99]
MTPGLTPVEFLYGINSSVSDDSRFYEPPRVVQFRITKKTPKRIYYVRRERIPGDIEIGYVNRQQIEADGEIYNHGAGGWWAPDFHLYLTPPALTQAQKPSLAELKSAMAAAHPDRGGTDEAFIAARARYERARTQETTR